MALIDGLYALIRRGDRSIAGIVPDVVIRETSRDEMIITDHPVERGAAISDHAFMRPMECDMQIGFSDSSAGYPGHALDMYQQLIDLQDERRPFDLFTGKRQYQNMLIASITCITDEKTENVAMITLRMREVIIVSTQTEKAPKSAQASPDKTGKTTDKGAQQAKPSLGNTGRMGFASPQSRA